MLKRDWLLIAFVYLAMAEALTWLPVSDLSLCLIGPPHNQQAANHDNEKYCPAFHTGIIATLDTLDGVLERHDKSVIGGFTIILAISTIGLWLATNKLWAAGEKQFGLLAATGALQASDMRESIATAREANAIARASAVASRRAWLDVIDVELRPPTSFNDAAFIYKIAYKIENLGLTLARNVDVNIETWYSENSTEAFPEVQERLLSRARKTPDLLGDTIFPNKLGGGTLLFDDHPEKFSKAIRTPAPEVRTVGFDIFITISYRIDGDEAVHVTQYVFSALNVPVPMEISASQVMHLQPMPFLSAVID
jgi:hypothetical protein